MFHVEGGLLIGPEHLHSQAEIARLGKVPIRDILMFKWLGEAIKIYINLEYTATRTPPELLNNCLIAIGGSAYP